MGYGGIFKKVLRIAVPIVIGVLSGGSPLAIALSSAATTGATGGSFKEALMAGATSYIGANISQGISGRIADANSFIGPPTAGFNLNNTLSGVNDAVTSGISDFLPTSVNTGLGGFIEAGKKLFKTPFDVLRDLGGEALMPSTALGTIAGGATTLTLNQALLANTPEADDLLAQQGYTPEQIQLLKNEARNALSQQAFERFQSETANPFGTDEAGLAEFNKVLASGIERENVDLGPDITEQQFNNRFNTPDLGNLILQDEQNLRKSSFGSEIDKSFTGNAFVDPIDDDIINSIVEERSGPARQQISNFSARGNLNPLGGKSANEFVTNQFDDARGRVQDVGKSVLGGTQQSINTLGDTARSEIGGYKLGDELFNAAPFSEQRQGLIDTQQSSLGDDIRGSLGNEPLFDINKALQAGGRVQGQVSGSGANSSFLDAIAAREGASNANRRGVGSRGSGSF